MSSDFDHLQRCLMDMMDRMDNVEKWKKNAAGLRVPAAVEDWNRYAEVSKEIAELREQVEKLKGHVEEIWEQLEPKDTLRQLRLVVN